jgi:hypothetical protein
VIFVGNAALAGRLFEAEDAAARIRKLYPHLRSSYLRLIFRVRKTEHLGKVNAMVDRIGLPE